MSIALVEVQILSAAEEAGHRRQLGKRHDTVERRVNPLPGKIFPYLATIYEPGKFLEPFVLGQLSRFNEHISVPPDSYSDLLHLYWTGTEMGIQELIVSPCLLYYQHMETMLNKELLRLSVSERIRLVEDIWDSIREIPEAVELTKEEKEELDKRLAAYHQNPSAGSPWEVVKARILHGE